MKKQVLLIFTLIFVTMNAQAIVELRAGYGVQTPSEDQIDDDTLKSLAGFNLDAIVELPLVPFGFGLRYENLASEVSISGVGNVDATFERTSLLINYRIIDLFAYFGLIGTFGFVNDYTIDFSGGSTKWDSSLTYSAGVEGGVSLGLIMLGAELGYIGANMSSSAQSDIDLSGIYAKALVGVGF